MNIVLVQIHIVRQNTVFNFSGVSDLVPRPFINPNRRFLGIIDGGHINFVRIGIVESDICHNGIFRDRNNMPGSRVFGVLDGKAGIYSAGFKVLPGIVDRYARASLVGSGSKVFCVSENFGNCSWHLTPIISSIGTGNLFP